MPELNYMNSIMQENSLVQEGCMNILYSLGTIYVAISMVAVMLSLSQIFLSAVLQAHVALFHTEISGHWLLLLV